MASFRLKFKVDHCCPMRLTTTLASCDSRRQLSISMYLDDKVHLDRMLHTGLVPQMVWDHDDLPIVAHDLSDRLSLRSSPMLHTVQE